MALAAVRTGTDNPETLVGTKRADKITAKGGNDLTIGKKGNDTYFYQNGWGLDPLIDSAGRDTLDFSAVTTDLTVYLCPELKDHPAGGEIGGLAGDGGSNAVFFQEGIVSEVSRDSRIEGARGGSGDDTIVGCTGSNRLSGGGGNNTVVDYGGISLLGLPDSSDTYVVRGGGLSTLYDFGSKADVLDMRAFRSDEVQMFTGDYNSDGEANSLGLLIDSETAVGIIGQFGPDVNGVPNNMRIESIKFKDKTISPKDPSSITLASSSTAERTIADAAFGGEMREGEDLLELLEPSEVLQSAE